MPIFDLYLEQSDATWRYLTTTRADSGIRAIRTAANDPAPRRQRDADGGNAYVTTHGRYRAVNRHVDTRQYLIGTYHAERVVTTHGIRAATNNLTLARAHHMTDATAHADVRSYWDGYFDHLAAAIQRTTCTLPPAQAGAWRAATLMAQHGLAIATLILHAYDGHLDPQRVTPDTHAFWHGYRDTIDRAKRILDDNTRAQALNHDWARCAAYQSGLDTAKELLAAHGIDDAASLLTNGPAPASTADYWHGYRDAILAAVNDVIRDLVGTVTLNPDADHRALGAHHARALIARVGIPATRLYLNDRDTHTTRSVREWWTGYRDALNEAQADADTTTPEPPDDDTNVRDFIGHDSDDLDDMVDNGILTADQADGLRDMHDNGVDIRPHITRALDAYRATTADPHAELLANETPKPKG